MLVVYVGVKYQDVRVGKWKGEAGKGEGPIVCVADQVPLWTPGAQPHGDPLQSLGTIMPRRWEGWGVCFRPSLPLVEGGPGDRWWWGEVLILLGCTCSQWSQLLRGQVTRGASGVTYLCWKPSPTAADELRWVEEMWGGTSTTSVCSVAPG